MNIALIIAGIVAFIAGKRKSKAVGKLSDAPVDLNNILMGVERGWYKARVDKLSTGYVVYLSGKKADGEYTEDVFPITKQTYDALVAQGISGINDDYVITWYKPDGYQHGAPVYLWLVFVGWRQYVTAPDVSFADWEQPLAYYGKAFDEKIYKTRSGAERALERIMAEGNGDPDEFVIMTWKEYTDEIRAHS